MLIKYKKKYTIFFNLKKITRTYLLSAKSIFWCLSSFFVREIVFNYDNVKNSFSRKILCINTEKIGDAVMSLDFINSIASYTDCYYLVQDYIVPLLSDIKLKSRLIPWNRKKYRFNPFYRINFLRQLHRLKFNIAINITPERGVVNDEIALLSGSKIKIALKNHSPYLPLFVETINNEWYDKLLKKEDENAYSNLLNMLKQLNIPVNAIEKHQLVNQSKENPYFKQEDKIICIAPFASDVSRSWELEKFTRLCKLLPNDYKIVLLGLNEKKKEIENIRGQLNNVYNFAGKLDLVHIVPMINYSSLFIGNDSGLTHIALYLKIPLVAIIGGGNYGRFFPYRSYKTSYFLASELKCFGCRWHCEYSKKYCMTDVTVDYVLDICNRLLKIG